MLCSVWSSKCPRELPQLGSKGDLWGQESGELVLCMWGGGVLSSHSAWWGWAGLGRAGPGRAGLGRAGPRQSQGGWLSSGCVGCMEARFLQASH